MKTRLISLALAGLFAAGGASAQSFQKPEDAIKYRKAAFTVLVAHFGPLGAMANGRMPFDAAAAARHGDAIAMVSTLPWAGFGPGTDKGDTRAKAESLGIKCTEGILTRAERIGLLVIGLVLSAWLPLAMIVVLWLLAILSNLTALQRVWVVRKATRDQEP